METNSITTTTLLEGLLDSGNDGVWRQFDARYRPVLLSFASRLGFNEADAADLTQQTLIDFVRDYRAGKFDRDRGRLGQWIIGIARNRAIDLRRALRRRREHRGHSALVRIPDPQRLSQIWDEEHHRCIVEQAMTALREQSRTSPETLRVFELLVIEGQPPAAVAEQCGVDVGNVYLIKSRMTERLRELMSAFEVAYQECG